MLLKSYIHQGMKTQKQSQGIHPTGERQMSGSEPLAVETFAGRVHVEWNPQAEVTPMGQLPFFIDFLKTAELKKGTFVPNVHNFQGYPGKRDALNFLNLVAFDIRYSSVYTAPPRGLHRVNKNNLLKRQAFSPKPRQTYGTFDRTTTLFQLVHYGIW